MPSIAATPCAMTIAAQEAQTRPDLSNPYIFSSPCWMAFEAARACAGMSTIRKAASSRGYSIRLATTGGSKVLVRFAGQHLDQITIERS